MTDQDMVLNMLHSRGGAMSRMAMSYNLQRDRIDSSAVLFRMENEGLIRYEDHRQGLESGCYVLTDIGLAACRPMPG